jgi:putative nucleotidyltransferase with HDIG domain
MNMNKATANTEKKSPFAEAWKVIVSFVRRDWRVIVLSATVFAAASLIVYFDASTTDTVASYALEDYEIGQIADRTIYARKSMSADESNPVAVEEGEKIIRKGFPITEQDYRKLKKMAESPAYVDYRAFSDNLLFLMLIGALWFVLFSPYLIGRTVPFKEMVLEAAFFLVIYAIAAFGRKSPMLQSVFALPVVIPSAFCVLLVAILFGQLSSFFFSILLAFGVLSADGFQIVPALFTLASCLSAARIVRNIDKRIDMVFASLLLSMLDVVFMVMLKVIFNDNFADAVFVLPGVAFNGFISGILALGFLTPFESILNTASVFRLMDLSDLNSPVMRRMMMTASGTYNHSMVVAQLAESACKEIGANALVARVGAYYHDIGKMDQPEYFVENQGGGENKHNEINPSLSVSVIRSHVKHGVEKAHLLRLPQAVVDIIAEHHGNSVISYFYNEAKKTDPNVNEEDFAYTGIPPTTRESAVVMLADTIEAACRTLDNPTVPRIDKFIQTLINAKIEGHQLDNSPLTFRDLTGIRQSFVQYLGGYYHTRVKYQNQKDPDDLFSASGIEGSFGASESGESSVPGSDTLDEAKKL